MGLELLWLRHHVPSLSSLGAGMSGRVHVVIHRAAPVRQLALSSPIFTSQGPYHWCNKSSKAMSSQIQASIPKSHPSRRLESRLVILRGRQQQKTGASSCCTPSCC